MADAKLKELVKKRAIFKAKLTQFVNVLNVYKSCAKLSELQASELECRLSRIDAIYSDYDALQANIELQSEQQEDQFAEREQFESQYYGAVSLARTLLAPTLQPPSGPVEESVPSQGSTSCRHDFVRLPKIDLPHFDGDYQRWLAFRDTYLSLIHNNNSLSDINKLHYLRAALKGSAALIVHSLELRSDNYAIAWQLLSDRYDNPRLLVNNHVQALFDFEPLQKESSVCLRNMIDVTNKNLRALATLGEPTDHWDTLIIFMMSRKLDGISCREWEEYRNILTGSPTLQQFLKFLNNRADLLETLFNNNKHNIQKRKTLEPPKSKSFITTTDHTNSKNAMNEISCPMCSDKHYLYLCPSFRSLSVDSRIKQATAAHVCLNCLRPGHSQKGCRLSHCKYCNIKHNTLLHKEPDAENVSSSAFENSVALSTDIVLANINTNQGHVLLSTALVKVKDIHGHLHTARLLLDNGSTANFITQSLCGKLSLVRRATNSTVSGINNQSSSTSESCDLTIQSYCGSFTTNINCYVLPKISQSLPSCYIHNIHIPKGIHLADPSYNVPSAIDILVGAEVFWDVLGSTHISLGKNQPRLHESKLGWIISGCIPQPTQATSSICNFTHTQTDDSLLTRFWELDSVPAKYHMSSEERLCEQSFEENTRRCKNGQFIVKIPLRDSPNVLGDSYTMAKNRFLCLERRLEKDFNFKEQYLEFMKEYIELGHMTENKIKTVFTQPSYFLPHHGVVRESSTTTKLRVVFDASASSTSGKSFNSIQMVGPTVQDDLMSILLRFREHKYVVTADIEKMYRAVLVEPSQRSLQQIVFRFDPSEPLKTYTLNTITYGTASGPYLATKCLTSLADQSPDINVQNAIKHNFYVDDFLYSGSSVESVIKTCRGVIKTLESAKFNLRKWQSNFGEILESISSIKGDSEKTLNLDHSLSKTLGLYWRTESDNLFYTININSNIRITKRSILSLISQVFDPLGLVGPCILLVKILLQQLWINKSNWDEEVGTDIKEQFKDAMQSISSLNSLEIPRWICHITTPTKMEVHVFTDASESAYGACVYIRSIGQDGSVCVRLLTSKNKVAPLKATTAPRLELCGALLGTRLFRKVLESLTIPIHCCYFWSDSTIVLGWLSTSPSRLKHFVRNRICEIQDSTTGYKWNYVPSKDNPADLVLRGMKTDVLRISSLWWSGPDFLQYDPIKFPKIPSIQTNQLPEISLHTDITTQTDNVISNIINKSSNFTKLIRIIAYIQRFINNCRRSNIHNTNYFSCSELNSSKSILIRIAQMEMFPKEYAILKSGNSLPKKNRLLSLSPFMDNSSVIRVGGRLSNSSYTYDIKHPIIICSKHHLTKIIFEMKHKCLMHAGPQLLLADIRQTYWPLGGRNLAKAVVHGCIRCNRFKATFVQPAMGDLPTDRTHLEFPFLSTGVDYCGPVLIVNRKGRGSTLIKSYICIFVCLAVKAVHLELVTDLTKEAYLAALSRFVARRGKPQRIYSDNGTNFVGACNELSSFLRHTSDHISSDTAEQGIEFKFIPAYSPHFGGLWEAAVKSVKHHLRRIMSLTHFTFEELSTCLTQIEAVLNSRPLTPLSSDPTDLTYLTPSHFLIGRTTTSVPYPQIEDRHIHSLSRFARVEKLKQHFWKRFVNDYIHLLQQKKKWRISCGELTIGQMVLVKENNLPPLLWLLGRVTKLIPGKDGVARVAEVKTKKGHLLRAYNRLVTLPIEAD